MTETERKELADKPLDADALEEAATVFEDHGIEFRFSWHCDLDDLEAERSYAFMEACRAYVAALRCTPVGDECATRIEWPEHVTPATVKRWADLIERTTTLTCVHETDCYGAAQHVANIRCFHDFEARRLVALLRAVAGGK